MSCASPLHAQLASVDSGAGGAGMAQWDDALMREWGASGPWVRIRARPDPAKSENRDAVAAEVAGLARLRELGFKPIPFYRWSNASWSQGVREGFGQRVPIDLREAYQRGLAYGRAYGAVVAGFEIENEPDISFVEENPETFLAYQKAVYLGLKRGSLSAEIGDGSSKIGSRVETAQATGSSQFHASGSPLPASPEPLAPRTRPIRPADRGIYAGSRAAALAPSSPLHVLRPQLPARRSSLPAKSPEPVERTPISDNQPPLIVMAPLALPPGPYFERLVANGLLSYTDAFNYHYYGYAEDFSGAYWQFHDAVRELSAGSDEREARSIEPSKSSTSGFSKHLPVLLTEYGYGLLDAAAGNTVEERVRQWQWFKTVADQIRDLRMAGAMGFYLPPYMGPTTSEFGLTMAPTGAEIPGTKSQTSNQAGCGDLAQHFMAGGLTFRPEDFGVTKPEPWMRHIGRKFGRNEATPALAWLYAAGKQRYTPRDWTVTAPRPSPIVIDFVAGDDLQQVKRYGGYLTKQQLAVSSAAREAPASVTIPFHSRARPKVAPSPPLGSVPVTSSPLDAPRSQSLVSPEPVERAPTSGLQSPVSGFSDAPLATGRGTLVLYNFSDTAIAGRIEITAGRDLLGDPVSLESTRVLEPMCRVETPVQLRIPAAEFTKHLLSLRFVPVADGQAPSSSLLAAASGFSTAFYPDPAGMTETVLFDFTDVGRDRRIPPPSNQAGYGDPALQKFSRLHAPGSQRLADNAALLSSRPLAVGEPRLEPLAGTRWRTTPGVNVTESPDGTWRFAINRFPAEPLRPAMAELPLPDDFVFPDGGMMRFAYRLRALGGAVPATSAYFEPYFRTANGNLYQVWPRQQAGIWWQSYAELKENYTMAFFGRANLPWRFAENRVVSLVFFFRPSALPAVFEIKQPRIVKLGIKSREY